MDLNDDVWSLSPRQQKALQIMRAVWHPVYEEMEPNTYKVNSQKGSNQYIVRKINKEWKCNCPDHILRKGDCKHIVVVKTHIEIMKHIRGGRVCFERTYNHELKTYMQTHGGIVTKNPEEVTCPLCREVVRKECVKEL